MRIRTFARVAGLALALTAGAGAQAASLVVNGSFEAPGVNNGSWSIFNSITGWSSTNGIEVRNNVSGTAYSGNNYVELDANSNSTIMQTIATQAGQAYELTFAYSPRIGQPAATNGISAFWNGNLLQNITAAGTTVNNWVLYTFFVTGTGSDQLSFSATGTSDSLGGNIDAVALSAVPLPGAALLFGSSILGFLGVKRRKA
jgi:hypothetical protein